MSSIKLDEEMFTGEVLAFTKYLILREQQQEKEVTDKFFKLLHKIYDAGYNRGKMVEADELLSSISPLVTKLQECKAIAQFKLMDYENKVTF